MSDHALAAGLAARAVQTRGRSRHGCLCDRLPRLPAARGRQRPPPVLDRRNQPQDKDLAPRCAGSRSARKRPRRQDGSPRGGNTSREGLFPPLFPSLFPCQAIRPCRPGVRDESTDGAFHDVQTVLLSVRLRRRDSSTWRRRPRARHRVPVLGAVLETAGSRRCDAPVAYACLRPEASVLASQNHRSSFAVTGSNGEPSSCRKAVS